MLITVESVVKVQRKRQDLRKSPSPRLRTSSEKYPSCIRISEMHQLISRISLSLLWSVGQYKPWNIKNGEWTPVKTWNNPNLSMTASRWDDVLTVSFNRFPLSLSFDSYYRLIRSKRFGWLSNIQLGLHLDIKIEPHANEKAQLSLHVDLPISRLLLWRLIDTRITPGHHPKCEQARAH